MKTFNIKKSTFVIASFLFLLLHFTHAVTAQEIQVNGVVKGQSFDKNEVLNGASIFLKNTNTGTISNKKGEFTFPKKLKKGDVLEISYLGFLKQKIVITEKTKFLNILLKEDNNQILGALNNSKRYKSKRQKE